MVKEMSEFDTLALLKKNTKVIDLVEKLISVETQNDSRLLSLQSQIQSQEDAIKILQQGDFEERLKLLDEVQK